MIHEDFFDFPRDIIYDRGIGVVPHVLFGVLCNAENDLVDEHGEWFNAKLGVIQMCMNNLSTRIIIKALKKLVKRNYIEVKDLHSKNPDMNLCIRVVPFEERHGDDYIPPWEQPTRPRTTSHDV